VQKYLEKCFLVYNRKFDIRCYILITTVNGRLKGYWYNDGYIRTSSEEYDLTDVSNRMIHLTNDAVQKHNTSYGKYEDFNKVIL
jgi:tubulin polyglutamylase TTLL1/tubulin monoglycylase TTLL3/8